MIITVPYWLVLIWAVVGVLFSMLVIFISAWCLYQMWKWEWRR